MGVQFDSKTKFLGVPISRARNVLKAWRWGSSKDPGDIALRRDVQLDPLTVTVLLAEMRQRGLMGYEEVPDGSIQGSIGDGLTQAGFAFATAALKRTPRSKAEGVLGDLLDASAFSQGDPDFPIKISRIWTFGSILSDSETLGDLDIVVEAEVDEAYRADPEALIDLAMEQGFTPRGSLFESDNAKRYLIRQHLYGGRRNPLLSEASVETLINLGCACKLVYDGSRGGIVSDPPLDRHPDSTGLAPGMRPKLDKPNLDPIGKIEPIPAALISPDDWSHDAWSATGLERSTLRFQTVLCGDAGHFKDWRAHAGASEASATASRFDGTKSFALAHLATTSRWERTGQCDERLATLIGVDRDIDDRGDCVDYTVKLSGIVDTSCSNNHSVESIAATAMLFIMADIKRITLRDEETQTVREIRVDLGSDGSTFARQISDRIADMIGSNVSLSQQVVILRQDETAPQLR